MESNILKLKLTDKTQIDNDDERLYTLKMIFQERLISRNYTTLNYKNIFSRW